MGGEFSKHKEMQRKSFSMQEIKIRGKQVSK